MDHILYADFTSAECYALNEQIGALGVAASVKWRGVQHAPGLPEPMRPLDRRGQDQVSDQIEVLRRIDPSLVISLPA